MNRLVSVSGIKRPYSVGKPNMGACSRQAFKGSNATCCSLVHVNVTPFRVKGFRQSGKVLDKSAVVTNKPDRLSHLFNRTGHIPSPKRRYLPRITGQASPANYMTQKCHFCLHESTLFSLKLQSELAQLLQDFCNGYGVWINKITPRYINDV